MNLKECPGCKKMMTTKNSKSKGRQGLGFKDILWLDCKACKSTFILIAKKPLTKAAA